MVRIKKQVSSLVSLRNAPAPAKDWQARNRDGRAWWEAIDDSDRVSSLLTALAGHRCRGQAKNAQGTSSVKVTGLSDSTLTLEADNPELQAPFDVAVQGAGAVYIFQVEFASNDGGTIRARRPQIVAQYRQRWSRRCQPIDDLRATLRAAHGPSDPVRGAIRDVSHDGLSVEPDVPAALPAGTEVIVSVHRTGAESIEFHAQVRHVIEESDAEHMRLGLKITTEGPQFLRWANVVDDILYPNTHEGRDHLDGIWELYGRCGYFLLCGRTQEGFERMQRAYRSVHKQLGNAPHLYKQIAWVDKQSQGVIGTGAGVKVYSGTWLAMQFAKLPGAAPDGTTSRSILTEMSVRLFEHVQRDPSLEWGHMTVFKDVSWIRHAFYEYAERMAPSDQCSISPFRVLELACDQDIDVPEHSYDVDEASEADLDLFDAHLQRVRPYSYRGALDLTRDKMDMARAKKLWHGQRLERDRIILSAKKGNETIATAVVEYAADGVHVSQFLNLVRLYALTDEGHDAFGALLLAAQEWLDDAEKERFIVYLEEDARLSPELRAQCIDFGESDMLFCRADRIPEVVENVYQVAAPRLADTK